MMKEKTGTLAPCPPVAVEIVEVNHLFIVVSSAIFQRMYTHALLISKHGDHLFQRAKKKKEIIKNEESVKTLPYISICDSILSL